MTISDIKSEIANSSVTAVVTAALERAKKDNTNALLEMITERALERAAILDKKRATGEEIGELGGVPFIAKDNMLTFGSHTTAASELLKGFEAPFQAEAIERLEEAGAVCIAKANLDAFAHGGSTENSAYGPTRNPVDPTRVAGGSSGGSAAAVARGIVPFALGTDTGGSIRQPASFCGVVGFKPSYGTVSRYGVVAMASSTDVIGPLCTTVEDAQLVTRIMAGTDAKDSTTHKSVFDTISSKPRKKIAVISEWLGDGVDAEVVESVKKALKKLEVDGYQIDEISIPALAHSLAVYYVIVPAEIASNLSRYDGIRYGNRPEAASSLQDVFSLTRTDGFMPENKRRILIGNYVLSSGYYDAYFKKAAKVRTLLIHEMNGVLETYDAIVGPTAPTVAFELGNKAHDPLSMYLADQMTVPASLTGMPSISVPISSSGLPVGLQLISRRLDDELVLALASDVERIAK